MIIPGGHDGGAFAQTLEARDVAQGVVGGLQFHRVVRVGIDVVAQQQEQVGCVSKDRRPDGLRFGLVAAGTEGDAADALGGGGGGEGQGEEGD